MLRAVPLAILILAGCGGPRRVTVRVLVPDLQGVETPLPGVVVAALPYDRDSLLAALEHRAPSGRPNTRALDSLFQRFRGPFLRFARAAWQVEQVSRERDTIAARRAAAAADTPAARELDTRLHALDDSLRVLTAALDRARAVLAAARDTLWPRIERLRLDVRRWELSTYAGYDTIGRRLALGRLRSPVADTTGADGWARIELPSGPWWIYARSPDPTDPNAEWYWNLPVTGDTIRLAPATGRHLSRY